jgi:hypothetical protein
MTSQSDLHKDLIARFWGFDRLIGSALIKIMYYFGIACIAIMVLVGVVGGLNKMGENFGDGLGLIFLALVSGAAGLVIWRFFCELGILAFQIYNRLGEIRDRIGPAAISTNLD